MNRTMRKVLAWAVVLMIALSAMGGALAADYPSKAFKLPAVKPGPTEQPTPAPVEPTEVPVEPTEAPVESEAPVEPTAEPTAVPTAEPEKSGATANGDADVRREADGLSEIIATIPDGTALNVVAVEGDWAKVEIDGQTGYIYKDSVNGVDFERREDDKPRPKVTIFSSSRSVMEPGEAINLTSKLEGFEEYSEISYQWECDKGDGFEAVPGANDDSYSFEANIETLSYSWRLVVSASD